MKMRLTEGVKTLLALFGDYKSMDNEDRADFYQSKCDYYQKYVGLCVVVGAFVSMGFLYCDYLINGTVLPTLLPRLSILLFILLYAVITHFIKGRRTLIHMDHFLVHAVVITTIWAMYYLENRSFANEGFMIINLMWMIVGFVGRPHEIFASIILFIAEILVSNSFMHYSEISILIALELFSAFGIVFSHAIFTLYYLDHYRMQQQLELAMITDPLTQVYNRHLLEKIVAKNTLKNVEEGEPIAIAMLDIDFFKKINDDYGHYTGDQTLLYIGQKLSNETHDNDYVIRYGGEEFVIIFRNCDVNNACARMEQFRRDIESAKDMPVKFTVSVGVSRYNGDYTKTLQNVDAALYKAKNTGRNKVVVV